MQFPLPAIVVWIVVSAALFGLVKLVFAFFGWLLEPEDRVFRKHLDALWDELHKRTLYQSVNRTLIVIHYRLLSLFETDRASKVFFWCSFAVSYLISLIALGFFGASEKGTFIGTIASISPVGHFGLLFLAMVLAFLAKVSLQTTTALLWHITSGSKLSVIILHALLQIALILIAFVITMAQFHFIAEPWLYEPGNWPGSVVWAILARIPELLHALPFRPLKYFLFVGILTLNCAFPTLAYLAALGLMCLIWPRWEWLVVRRVIYLLTTNKSPVLKQLGDFFGGLAAALTFMAQLIKH